MRQILFSLFLALTIATSAWGLILGPSASTLYAPNAPTISASSASATSNSITWSYGATDASHGQGTSISLYRGTASGGESGTPVATNITTSPYPDTGLTTNQIYYYFARAVNTAGASGNSNEVSATPSSTYVAPYAPTNVAATAGDASASVSFTASATDATHRAAASYTATSSGGQTGTGSASPITVAGLSNGTPYTFTVTATNADGTSSPSTASSSVTPQSGGGTYTATFDGAAGTTVDSYSGVFAKNVSGAGTANLDGSGRLLIYNSVDTDGAFVSRAAPVTATAKTYKVKVQTNATMIGDNQAIWGLILQHSATRPALLGAGNNNSTAIAGIKLTVYSGLIKAAGVYFDNTGSGHEFDGVNGWTAAGVGLTNYTASITADTYYWLYLYTTSTGWSIGIKAADDATNVLAKTTEIPWSSTAGAGENMWLQFGDMYTYAWKGGMYVDTYMEY